MYSVSHDLRTPLNTINGFSNLLGKEIGADAASERSKHYLARIRTGAVQMGELIDALLSLAQVSRTSLGWDRVDLSAMAQTILNGYQEREPGGVWAESAPGRGARFISRCWATGSWNQANWHGDTPTQIMKLMRHASTLTPALSHKWARVRSVASRISR